MALSWNHIWFSKDSNGKDSTTIYNLQIISNYHMALVCFKMHPVNVIFVVELQVTMISLHKKYKLQWYAYIKKHMQQGRQHRLPVPVFLAEVPYSPKTVRSALAKLRCAFSISSRTMTSFRQQTCYAVTRRHWQTRHIIMGLSTRIVVSTTVPPTCIWKLHEINDHLKIIKCILWSIQYTNNVKHGIPSGE